MTAKTPYGKQVTVNGNLAIRFERKFNHTPEKIWNAITDSGQLSRWFPADIRGERKTGAPIQIISFTERFLPVKGAFTAFEPHHLLEYTWGDGTGCKFV